MIQADEALLERARRRAGERGVSIAQVVREALEHELGAETPPPPATSVGIVASDELPAGRRTADHDAYAPDAWR